MTRTGCALVVLLGFMGVSTPASAGDGGPYMWGAGFKLGTSFLPGRYPWAFPSSITNYDFTDTGPNAGAASGKNEGRDLTAGGDPGFTTLQPVGFDFRLGGEAFYGFDAKNRLGAGVGLGFGGHYFDGWFTLNYDHVLYGADPVDIVGGLQAGYGSVKWRGTTDADESLKMSYYPVRGRVEAQFRDKVRMYGLGLFVQDAIPARTAYTDLDGNVQPTVGSVGNFALFPMVGIEADVQFGDFTPPKKANNGPDHGKKHGKDKDKNGNGNGSDKDKNGNGNDNDRQGNGKPGDGKPGDGKPGDGKPGDGKPGDGKPGDGKPGDGNDQPGDGKRHKKDHD